MGGPCSTKLLYNEHYCHTNDRMLNNANNYKLWYGYTVQRMVWTVYMCLNENHDGTFLIGILDKLLCSFSFKILETLYL